MTSRADEIRDMSRTSRLKGALESDELGASEGRELRSQESGRINCPICDEDISAKAKKCRHCGEVLDVGIRMSQDAQRGMHGNVYRNPAPAGYGRPGPARGSKSKIVAFLLAWFLGGFGAHKFYLDRVGQGIFYLLFCWTLIPMIIAFIEGIVYLTMSEERFWEKYG